MLKYTETILYSETSKLPKCWDSSLRKYFVVSFIIIFRTLSFPICGQTLYRRRLDNCENVADCENVEARVVHGSILCDPIQPNTSADWPNPTHYKWKNLDQTRPNPIQPNTTNNRAYSLVLTYFYTQNLSISGTGQIGRKIKFNCLVKPNLI